MGVTWRTSGIMPALDFARPYQVDSAIDLRVLLDHPLAYDTRGLMLLSPMLRSNPRSRSRQAPRIVPLGDKPANGLLIIPDKYKHRFAEWADDDARFQTWNVGKAQALDALLSNVDAAHHSGLSLIHI